MFFRLDHVKILLLYWWMVDEIGNLCGHFSEQAHSLATLIGDSVLCELTLLFGGGNS